jgi:hypothetical protein
MNKGENIQKIISIIYNAEKSYKNIDLYMDEYTKLSFTYDLVNHFYGLYFKNDETVNDNKMFNNLCNNILDEYHFQISNKNELGLPLLFYWPQYKRQ